MIFYSRKPLITNYGNYYDENINSNLNINLGENKLIVKESDYGTCIFNKDITDLRFILNEINDEKVMFYIIDSSLIEDFDDFIEFKKFSGTTDGFLYKETIYRIGE